MSSVKKHENLYDDTHRNPSEEKKSLELLINKLKEEIESKPSTQKRIANILSLYIKDS